MNERRCPSCGALVGADAEWCGQCLTPLPGPDPGSGPERTAATTTETTAGESAPVEPSAPEEPDARPERPVRVEGDRVLWTCPTCERENPVEERVCPTCGTPFVELFEESRPRPLPAPQRAVALSAVFPGAGHIAAGRVAEGLARAVVFAYSVGTGLVILLSRRGLGLGPFLPLVAVFVVAAVALYAITVVDAQRVARGVAQLLSTRMLLYGATGLMVLTLVVLVVSGLRAGSA